MLGRFHHMMHNTYRPRAFFRLNSGVFILKNNFTEFYFLFPFLWSIVLCHQISLPIYRDLISEILTFAAHKMVYLYYNAGDAVSRINTDCNINGIVRQINLHEAPGSGSQYHCHVSQKIAGAFRL